MAEQRDLVPSRPPRDLPGMPRWVILGGGAAALVATLIDPALIIPFLALGGSLAWGMRTLIGQYPRLLRGYHQARQRRIEARLTPRRGLPGAQASGARGKDPLRATRCAPLLTPPPVSQPKTAPAPVSPAAATAQPARTDDLSTDMAVLPRSSVGAWASQQDAGAPGMRPGDAGWGDDAQATLQRLLLPPVSSAAVPDTTPTGADHRLPISYHPEQAHHWQAHFPGLRMDDLQPLHATDSAGTSQARTPLHAVASITRRLEQAGVSVQRIMLGLRADEARAAGTIGIGVWLLDREPDRLDWLRSRVAAVVSREGTSGGWSLLAVLAQPCGYDPAGRPGAAALRVRRQHRLIAQLPVAPALLTWKQREQWPQNGLRIPLGVVVSAEDATPRTAWFDLTAQTHLGVFARTGAGKDATITTWLFALFLTHNPQYLAVAVCDPKGADYAFCGMVPHALFPVAVTPEEIRDRIATLAALVAFRGQLLGAALPGGTAVMDEVNALPMEQKRRAWETVAARWPADAPYQPGAFPASAQVPHILLIVTECNAPIFAEPEVDRQLQTMIKQGRAVALHLIVTAQQVQGLARMRSQIAVMACGPMRTVLDGVLALAREDSQGVFAPHAFPVPNRKKPETLGLFVLAEDEEMLLRSFFLAPEQRAALVERFAAVAARHPGNRLPSIPAPAPPSARTVPEAATAWPSDDAIREWAAAYQRQHGKPPSQRGACAHFFGSKTAERMAFVKQAFLRLGLLRTSEPAQSPSGESTGG